MTETSGIDSLNKQLDEVKAITIENVGKLINNMDAVEQTAETSRLLKKRAQEFQRIARRKRCQECCRNMKLWIILIIVIIILILAIVLIVAIPVIVCHYRDCK